MQAEMSEIRKEKERLGVEIAERQEQISKLANEQNDLRQDLRSSMVSDDRSEFRSFTS